MADKKQENPVIDKDINSAAPSASNAARSKTLMISIITFAILITFALWTLLRTDFTTYPNPDEVDIIEITKVSDALQDDPEDSSQMSLKVASADPIPLSSEDPLSLSSEDPLPMSLEDLLAAESPEEQTEPKQTVEVSSTDPHAAIHEATARFQVELNALKIDFEILEKQLTQRELEIARLHQDLEAARNPAPVVALFEDISDDAEDNDAPRIEDLQKQTEQLRQTNGVLESQLADSRQRLKESQEALHQGDARARDAEAKVRELTKRQDELTKRLDAALKERTKLDDKIVQQQAKLAAQERSFQELGNALKSHKQALKQMDQARMEMAAELDTTKKQYAKLAGAMAAADRDTALPSIKQSVALVSESVSTAPSTQEGQEVRYHVVSKGDTLTSISRHYYGTSQRWNEIYEANKAVLADHNRLKVGLVLAIP